MYRNFVENAEARNGEYRVHAEFEAKTFFNNEKKGIYSDGVPDLHFNRIGCPPVKHLNPEVALYPFEK
jgi:hypothetical protein